MKENQAEFPRVVACLPAFNAGAYIRDTLSSLASQTYPNLGILISDDASTDDTPKICEQFVAQDDRFVLIRQASRLGWIANTNALLRMVEADYVFRVGQDDPYRSNFVSRLVDVLERNPAAVLAFSDIERVGLDGSVDICSFRLLDGVTDPLRRGIILASKPPGSYIVNHGVFRSSVLRQSEGLKYNLVGEVGADWPWHLGLALQGEFVRVPEVLNTKVYREENLSQNWKRNRRSRIALTISCWDTVHDSLLAPRERLQVYRALAYGLARVIIPGPLRRAMARLIRWHV